MVFNQIIPNMDSLPDTNLKRIVLKAGSARYPFTIFLPQTTLNQEI